jgi:hypothetical protein
MTTRIQIRRGTAAAWTSANPQLSSGEQGLETDTGKVKYGDGVTLWNELSYFSGGAVAWEDVTDKPSEFAPSTHTHAMSQVTGLVEALGGKATLVEVEEAIAALVASAPGTLDTLDEIAAALGDDPNLATTLTTLIGTKLAKASNLSDLVDASIALTNLGLTENGKSLATAANYAAMRILLGLVIGTDVQAALVSGTNIKTINSTSLLGSGDIVISASPGGADTQVQFNDGTAFGGDSGLTFNKTTNALTVGGKLTVQQGTSGDYSIGFVGSTAAIYGDSLGRVGLVPGGSGYGVLLLSTTTVMLPGDATLGFALPGFSGNPDIGIARNAVGILEINNNAFISAAVANARDLKLRHIIMAGISPTVDGSNTISGKDGACQVTVVGTPSSIVITFGVAFPSAPAVIAQGTTTGSICCTSTTTTATLTKAGGGNFTTSEVLHVVCIGF